MTTHNTFLRYILKYKQYHESGLFKLLSKEEVLVASLYNNQKGHSLKCMQGGSSNKFIKVTGRFFKQFVPIPESVYSSATSKCHITYIYQDIPSPSHMIVFEDIVGEGINKHLSFKHISKLLSSTLS